LACTSGVGTEHGVSGVLINGVYGAGNDVNTDEDLVSVKDLRRLIMVHDYPPVKLAAISFDVLDGKGRKTASIALNGVPRDEGVDRPDRDRAHDSPNMSVMIDGSHVVYYGHDFGANMKFNRKTRKYE
jgi:hypothetical protein